MRFGRWLPKWQPTSRDLSDNMNLVDQWLNGVSETVDVMHRRILVIQEMFSKQGMTAIKRFLEIFSYVGTILPSTGSIYAGGFWLVPLLRSLSDEMGALQHSKWEFEKSGPHGAGYSLASSFRKINIQRSTLRR